MNKSRVRGLIFMRRLGLFAVAILLSVFVRAQPVSSQIITADWAISDPNFKDIKWGAQKIVFQVRNNSDNYKFFVVKNETRSPMRRHGDIRTSQSNYIFVPGEEKEVSLVLDVPENFTFISMALGFYDVVDTVDDLTFGKELYVDTFKIEVPLPVGLSEYANSLPKGGSILKFNPSLKTDLSLLINKYLQEPSSIAALSKKLELPFAVISRIVRKLEAYGHVRDNENNTYQSNLTPIEGLPAAAVNDLIGVTSSRLVEALAFAVPKFKAEHQRMMDSGLVTLGDKETLEGTGMLHHLFPLIGGITLWESVGSQFIIGGEGPPQLVNSDAPCDLIVEGYGYVLLDSSLRDGDEFYFYDPNLKRRVFGDHVPSVLCTRGRPGVKANPSYYLPSKATVLMYDHDYQRVADIVKILSDPLLPIRDKFSARVDVLFEESGVTLTSAHRFWLWNQLVTSTMNKLINEDVIERGQRRFYTWKERIEK